MGAVYHDFDCPRAVCRVNLHDPWPDYSLDRGRTPPVDSTEVAYQNICVWMQLCLCFSHLGQILTQLVRAEKGVLTGLAGGGLIAVADISKMGEKIIVGGFFVQLFFFGCFIIISAIFHHRMRVAPTHKSLDSSVRWQTYLITLYVTGVLIWARSLFQLPGGRLYRRQRRALDAAC